jgi:naphthoate synthase
MPEPHHGDATGNFERQSFSPSAWRLVDGFADLTDITYHHHVTDATVRVAFNRPEVRNAFRPHTVDELYQAFDHARMSPDVGVVLLTGNGPSRKDGGWAFCSGGDQRIRGRSGYQYAFGETADTVDVAHEGRLHILEVQRLIRFMPKVVICLESVGVQWAAEINAKSPQAQRMLKYAFNLLDDGLVGQQLFAGEATGWRT